MFEKKNQNLVTKQNIETMAPTSGGTTIIKNVSNWYSDKYNSTLIQRNILLLVAFFSVIAVSISVFVVGNIASNYKIEPFVIDVEETTGLTTIVNPIQDKSLSANDALNKYFITTYIRSRESYNIVTYQYEYLTVVRLLSSPNVYSDFRRFLNSPNSPIAVYGNQTSTSVAFRSIQLFPPSYNEKGVPEDSKAVVRYTIFPGDGSSVRGVTGNRIHKIVTLTYRFDQTEMSEADREINPIGFFVTSFISSTENESLN